MGTCSAANTGSTVVSACSVANICSAASACSPASAFIKYLSKGRNYALRPFCLRVFCVLLSGVKEWVYKPGSVIGNHLSRLHVTMQLKHATRTHGKAAVQRSYLRLLQMGFTKLRRCRRTGALLPHRFSFSPAAFVDD